MLNNLPHNYPLIFLLLRLRNNPLEATFTRNSVFTSFSHRQDVEYLIYDGSDSPSVISAEDGPCSFYYHYHHYIDNGIYGALRITLLILCKVFGCFLYILAISVF